MSHVRCMCRRMSDMCTTNACCAVTHMNRCPLICDAAPEINTSASSTHCSESIDSPATMPDTIIPVYLGMASCANAAKRRPTMAPTVVDIYPTSESITCHTSGVSFLPPHLLSIAHHACLHSPIIGNHCARHNCSMRHATLAFAANCFFCMSASEGASCGASDRSEEGRGRLTVGQQQMHQHGNARTSTWSTHQHVYRHVHRQIHQHGYVHMATSSPAYERAAHASHRISHPRCNSPSRTGSYVS